MEYVLQTKDLTKVFGKRTAVSGLNLNVYKGDIYGFIGRNGAGKTTFIRMVAGLARPSKGSIQLFESDDLDTQRRKTGTMIENPAVFPQMTAKQNLHYYCRLLGLDPAAKIPEMLNLVGLSDTGKKKAKNFSLGMKQRLAIGISLLGDPEFLMLDEPINGLDPTGIKEIRELILHLNRERKITILISSHILGELSRIANRYGVINNGVMVTEFTNEELEQRCLGELEIKVDKTDEAVNIITGMLEKDAVKVLDEHTIRVSKNLEKAGAINTELAKNGITVNSSSIVGQDLEAYFMQLMESTEKSYV
ncbi:ATP-binding cassette domain-containing protein [Anaerocolumna sp. AGMB13020]|uniref:ATP-binding cassette domain-containing protein n=1 Tax=Anaerocolumna sp. AGMB13020 TaxID=3081750 RepID=UPI00295394C2|nr:ATP-binding cassette domain-containing protein [Anaerocolumna sp. AGMB13020]WOO38704.1 ATP-binding cassette domain-containing protein [Anaerocolumna sp. AGMB13020]